MLLSLCGEMHLDIKGSLMRVAMWFIVSVLFGVGCSGPKHSPVSGRVTLDGKPLPNAAVLFQPKSTGDNPNPGLGSGAKTDGDGNYTLTISGTNELGAIVGKHRVEISAFDRVKEIDPNSDRVEKPARNLVPPKYNNQSTLEFDVPAGGTKDANFELSSK